MVRCDAGSVAGQLPAEAIADRVQLRRRVGSLALGVSDAQLAHLIRHVGSDADLAETAMQLLPRPQWVADIIGGLT